MNIPGTTSPRQLEGSLDNFNQAIKKDPQFLAFTNTEHISASINFAIKSVGSDDAILCTFNQGYGHAPDGLFSLAALPDQWQNLFKKNPEMPYQSFWALYGQNIHQEGVEVIGDQIAFANYAHVWRSMLDVLHDVYCGPNVALLPPVSQQQQNEEEEDQPDWSLCLRRDKGLGGILCL